ncbi:MAG: amino acid permease [Woeseia sp.]|nr:amino acid permease [Woeseia sp.]|tara:strand:+ start:1496 stop:2818 length:1323 start_codon:yes stop_codon:yes gene_type:complete
MPAEKFRFTTVTAVVIANMVGTGVFTSLGFQLLDIQSGFVILLLWAIGGLIAVCGAMTYAELGAAMPRSGGEYNFLSRLYHPAAGFVSGWVSATIGFAGPTALAAITFSAYATSITPALDDPVVKKLLAIGLIVGLTILHSGSRRNSGGIQILFTILKVVVILLFCITALQVIETPQPINFVPIKGDSSLIMSGAFAVSLIYVSYAYTGWNAATYLSSELIDPQRTLPGILITGTLIVTILYVALNFVFLYAAPVDLLQGQIEIGYVAAQAAFGDIGARFTGLILALLLVSTVSAMTIAGPRVLQVIGEDFNALRFLAKKNGDGIPTTAIYLQSTIAISFILSSTFESILIFAGFTLALNSFATVLSVFVLRWKQTQLDTPYKTFLFPIPPIIYLTLTGWTLWFVLINRPIEVLFSFGIIGSGLIVYCLSRTRGPDQNKI